MNTRVELTDNGAFLAQGIKNLRVVHYSVLAAQSPRSAQKKTKKKTRAKQIIIRTREHYMSDLDVN
jgi:hypothetical protein